MVILLFAFKFGASVVGTNSHCHFSTLSRRGLNQTKLS